MYDGLFRQCEAGVSGGYGYLKEGGNRVRDGAVTQSLRQRLFFMMDRYK